MTGTAAVDWVRTVNDQVRVAAVAARPLLTDPQLRLVVVAVTAICAFQVDLSPDDVASLAKFSPKSVSGTEVADLAGFAAWLAFQVEPFSSDRCDVLSWMVSSPAFRSPRGLKVRLSWSELVELSKDAC